MMLVNFQQWVSAIIGNGYTYSIGMWMESTADASKKYCAIRQNAPAMSVDDRAITFTVTLIGRRDQRGDSQVLLTDAEKLVQSVIDGVKPCEAAGIKLMSGPNGPGATTENRSWVQVDFQTVF